MNTAKIFSRASKWITVHCYIKFSRHPWYTPSGLICRMLACLASNWYKSPNDLFPVVVFLYGLVDVFGITKSVFILRRITQQSKKKLRSIANARHKEEEKLPNMRDGARSRGGVPGMRLEPREGGEASKGRQRT